jgi:intracellular sulfur oxidation DsrE/DsrF family protein
MSVIQQWQGSDIRFETRKDGRVWGCLTDMAQATGKLVADYLRLVSTQDYLQALSDDMGIPIANILYAIPGQKTGTWAIDEVVIDFAQWCNVKFRIWVNRVIRSLIIEKSASFLDDSVEEKALSMISNLINQMEASVSDPLAVSRYGKAIDVLNVTLHRNQTAMLKDIKTNSVSDFLEQHVEEFKGEKMIAKDLYHSYCRFCLKNKYTKETLTSFGKYVSTVYEKHRTNKGVIYLDMRLK